MKLQIKTRLSASQLTACERWGSSGIIHYISYQPGCIFLLLAITRALHGKAGKLALNMKGLYQITLFSAC